MIKNNTMNYKLIMLPTPILVSDEQIKVGDWYTWDGNKNNSPSLCTDLYNENSILDSIGFSVFYKVLAGIEGLPSLDLSVIAEEIGWVDVERLAVSAFQKRFNREPIIMGSAEADSSWLNTWVDGFKAAQSLNEKKYTDADLRKAWEAGMRFIGEDKGDYNKMLMSLSTHTEYQVEVEMEIIRQNQCINKCASYPSACLCEMTKQPKITNNTIKVTKIL